MKKAVSYKRQLTVDGIVFLPLLIYWRIIADFQMLLLIKNTMDATQILQGLSCNVL